jgi:hypothetical protein
MTLHPIERILVNALEDGQVLSLEDFGGLPELEFHKSRLAKSPFTSKFIDIVLSNINKLTTHETKLAESFILDCFEKITDEFVIQEAIDCFESYRPLSKNLEDKCFRIALQEAQNLEKSSITRAWNLEAALRLSIEVPARRYQLLSYLVELNSEDEPEYLRHAAKIIGLTNAFWQDDALIVVLENLAISELASDEVYFELGLASLAKALDSESSAMARNQFKETCTLLQKSMDKREQRPDAEAYHAAISILLAFEKNNIREEYAKQLERFKKAVTIYSAWHGSDAGTVWISARKVELVNWHILATKLEALSGYLAEPNWFEPTVVIEQALLNIYAASRTIFRRNKSGGLEALIQPNIEASFIHNQGYLYILEKWLERQPPEDLKDLGKELKQAIDSHKLKVAMGKSLGAAVESSELTVPFSEIIENLPLKKKSSFEQVLEDYLDLQKKDTSPVLEKILGRCISELSSIESYKDQRVRQCFNTLLFQTLRFLENRMDMTRKNNPRLSYLFEIEKNQPLPKEQELQNDYFEFMHGNISAGDIAVEKSDISSGRVDVYFSFGSIHFTAEVKRDDTDCTFSGLRKKYIGQTAEYQNTNVKLGFLLVLDLTAKANGVCSMEENIKVEIVKSVSTIERAVIVIRIPGMRKTPSAVTLGKS